jgi:CHASE3 domain sensor protein
MICPNCGKENASPFGYCAFCQKPLSTVGGAAAMPGLDQTAQRPKAMSIPAKIFLALTIVLAVLLVIVKPVEPGDPAVEAGQYMGGLLGLVGIPALVAFVVAGRKKARHPNRFALVFCVISGILILGNAASMLGFEPPQQRFGRLLREAAGTQPVSRKGLPSQRKLDDAVRAQYGKLLQENRDYLERVKGLDNSRVKEVNTAAALASEEAGRPGLDQLHALYDADAAHEQEVQKIFSGLRHVFDTASSPAERDAMLKGFDESVAQQNARRQQALAMEKAWVDAVDDEHAYAAAHRSSIRLAQDILVIVDPKVRSELNARIELQEQKRKAFLKSQEEFKRSQAESLHNMGVSGKDLGEK